jgi:hypothetical protein
MYGWLVESSSNPKLNPTINPTAKGVRTNPIKSFFEIFHSPIRRRSPSSLSSTDSILRLDQREIYTTNNKRVIQEVGYPLIYLTISRNSERLGRSSKLFRLVNKDENGQFALASFTNKYSFYDHCDRPCLGLLAVINYQKSLLSGRTLFDPSGLIPMLPISRTAVPPAFSQRTSQGTRISTHAFPAGDSFGFLEASPLGQSAICKEGGTFPSSLEARKNLSPRKSCRPILQLLNSCTADSFLRASPRRLPLVW